MSDITLGLEDRDFWKDPKKNRRELSKQLSKENYSGVLLGGPSSVPLGERETLPVVCVRAGWQRELAALNFEEHALITAVDLDENRLYTDFTEDLEFHEPEDPSKKEEPAEMYSTGRRVLELREILGLPWHPSRYLVTLILREQVSNRLPVELSTAPGAYRDDAVEEFVHDKRSRTPAPKISPAPGQPLPSYVAREDSPPIPDEPGLSLAVDRALVMRPDAECVLRGSFRLPALPQEIVKPGQYDEPGEGQEPRPPTPTAVVGIHLLITGAEQPDPFTVLLHVPSYDPIESGDAAPIVTGHFALDLLRAGGISSTTPQTSFLYAFSGVAMAGPVPIALISEDRLPGGRPE